VSIWVEQKKKKKGAVLATAKKRKKKGWKVGQKQNKTVLEKGEDPKGKKKSHRRGRQPETE